jgi:hypothetical protein
MNGRVSNAITSRCVARTPLDGHLESAASIEQESSCSIAAEPLQYIWRCAVLIGDHEQYREDHELKFPCTRTVEQSLPAPRRRAKFSQQNVRASDAMEHKEVWRTTGK